MTDQLKQTLEGLRRERDLVARIMETSPVGITTVSRDGQVIFANPQAEQVLGLAREEITQRTYNAPEWRITDYDGGPFPDEELPFRRVMSTGQPVRDVQHAIVRPDGRRVLLSINGAPLLDESRQVEDVILTLEDITERKHAEEAQRRLNRELRAISDCNQILMRAVDEQALLGDICRIVCDEAGYRMAWVGYAENDGAQTVRPVAWAGSEDGYLASANITWADMERGRGSTGTAIRTGESICIQDFMTEPQAIPWRENALQRGYRSNIALPLKDESVTTFGALTIYSTEPKAFIPDEIRLLEELAGDLAFGIGVLRARIERKRAEQKIGQLAAIVASSDDAIIGKTLDGIITSWNKGAEKIYGYTESEVIGKSIVILVPPGNEDELPQILGKIKAGEHVEHFETVRRRKDAQDIHMSLAISPIRDTVGQIVAASTIGRDITDRKRAEEEIHRLNQDLEQRVADRTAQLEAANKELEAFAYSVSHDLRAPLRHIDGFLELLQQRMAATLDEQSQHFMAAISEAARRMGLLIDDLLSFSRMGRHELSKMPVDLNALVQEVIRELEPDMQGRAVNWHMAQLPVVTGDQAMLRIVLVNLISNALKFTRSRQPAEIEIGFMRQANEAVFFVRDNGVGFDPQYADKLFGVFQRLHRADEFEGTGIGLANVRRIITQHGGRTWATGAIDHGATFYFSLPQSIQGA